MPANVHKLPMPNGYTIDRGIPAPSRPGASLYPFPEMNVGDSFVAASEGVRTAAQNWGKNHGKKFSSRRQTDGTIRVWRIA